jgi:hypothetical protein
VDQQAGFLEAIEQTLHGLEGLEYGAVVPLMEGLVTAGLAENHCGGEQLITGFNPVRSKELLMSSLTDVQARNRELADQINEEALRNPQSPYTGKFVGIANGQVVVVADNLEEMAQRLEQIEPDPAKCFSVEASRDYNEVVEIWSLP